MEHGTAATPITSIVEKLLEAAPVSVALAALVLLIAFVVVPLVRRRSATVHRPPVPEPIPQAVREELAALARRITYHAGRVSEMHSDAVGTKARVNERLADTERRVFDLERHRDNDSRGIVELRGRVDAAISRMDDVCERVDLSRAENRADVQQINLRLDKIFENKGA